MFTIIFLYITFIISMLIVVIAHSFGNDASSFVVSFWGIILILNLFNIIDYVNEEKIEEKIEKVVDNH